MGHMHSQLYRRGKIGKNVVSGEQMEEIVRYMYRGLAGMTNHHIILTKATQTSITGVSAVGFLTLSLTISLI